MTTNATKKYNVTICGPNLNDQSKGAFQIHKVGCRDIKRIGGEPPWNAEVTCRAEVICDIYGDHMAEGSTSFESAESDIHFAPCVKSIPAGDPSEYMPAVAPTEEPRETIAVTVDVRGGYLGDQIVVRARTESDRDLLPSYAHTLEEYHQRMTVLREQYNVALLRPDPDLVRVAQGTLTVAGMSNNGPYLARELYRDITGVDMPEPVEDIRRVDVSIPDHPHGMDVGDTYVGNAALSAAAKIAFLTPRLKDAVKVGDLPAIAVVIQKAMNESHRDCR